MSLFEQRFSSFEMLLISSFISENETLEAMQTSVEETLETKSTILPSLMRRLDLKTSKDLAKWLIDLRKEKLEEAK